MSFAARAALKHLLAPTRVAIVLGVLAAVACEDSSEPSPPPASSPTAAVATATSPATPTATATPTVVATLSPTSTTTPSPTSTSTPSPTPTASPTETPTPEPSPTLTPTAKPAPEPPLAIDLVEPAPGAFEHRTFESGEPTGWDHGIFVLDPATGLTDGYRVPGADIWRYYEHLAGGWVLSQDQTGEWDLLLHRASALSWRWPHGALRPLATSSEHVLFHDQRSHSSGSVVLVNRQMERAAAFTVGAAGTPNAHFSPDGSNIILESGGILYHISVDTGIPKTLLEAETAWIDRWYGGPGIRVWRREDRTAEAPDGFRYFEWNGDASPGPACQSGDHPSLTRLSGTPWYSPDGRYASWLEGGPAYNKHQGFEQLENPWPTVVFADATTCAPLFRVRSAHTSARARGEWLATSEGRVVGTHDGPILVRVTPAPAIVPLLHGGHPDYWDSAWYTGPQPAPTGDGRFFGYGWSVYDAFEERWILPPTVAWDGPHWWGDSHRERWFTIVDVSGVGLVSWLRLPPKIEFPPFSDEIAFRVAPTGDCLHIREEPSTNSVVTDCLADGTRLVLSVPDERWVDPNPNDRDTAWDAARVHPSLAFAGPGRLSSPWVYVRTEDGTEGWVSHDYLEHD